MEQAIEFITNHWALSGLFAALLATLVYTENLKKGASVSIHEATRTINQEQGVVVDLRSKAEFSEGHIVGAINIPFAELASRITELEKHKQKPIILVCKMGQHSGSASKMLSEAGFATVKRMNGGLTEWTGANLPLVKG